MKTRCIKIMMLAAAAAAMGVQAQTTDTGENTRVDYLDSKGNVIYSCYPGPNGLAFQVSGNDTPTIQFTEGTEVSSMKFTQWGEESYPVTVETADPSGAGETPAVSYEVLGDAGNLQRHTRGESDEVRCGAIIRFTIDVPEGTYPMCDVTRLMTYGGDMAFTLGSIGEHNIRMYPRAVWDIVWDCNSQEYLKEMIGSTGLFERDTTDPNRWYLELPMSNEPMKFEFYTARRDSEYLKWSARLALDELYYQNRDLWNYHAGGEPLFMALYGDYLSQDFVSGLYSKIANTARTLLDFSDMCKDNGNTMYLWRNAQAYVTHANLVLQYIDNFDAATPDVRDWARAQMLSLRSLGYLRLMQLYGTRWQDSGDGEAYCVPLALTFPAFDQPLAKMKDIRDRCYADIDEAVSLFGSHNWTREAAHEFDKKTALGLKVRIALLCEDWNIARENADAVLAGMPLTSNEDLKAGFFKPADSWLWSVSNYRHDSRGAGQEETVYQNQLWYASVQSYDAVNGSYPALWTYGVNSIDKDLYLSMSENDVRRSLYVMPDQLSRITFRPYNTMSGWYDADNFCQELMIAWKNSYAGASAIISKAYNNKKPEDVTCTAFMQIGDSNQYLPVMLGSQVKFYQPGTEHSDEASVVLMRAEEMLLAHAEACYRLGDAAAAKADLHRLNGMRDSGYSFSGEGTSVIDEIIRTRKIELWGEGHSWYDQKRWNIPIERRRYVQGDPESGNWHQAFQTEVAAGSANGWRWVIPAAAVKFDPQINRDLMNYDNLVSPQTSPEKTVVSIRQSEDFTPVKSMREMQP